MENRNEDIYSKRSANVRRPESMPPDYNPEPGQPQGQSLERRAGERMNKRREKVDQRGGGAYEKTGVGASERDFSTHYYGNEKDLRAKDKRARESDIGREPYRASESQSEGQGSFEGGYRDDEYSGSPRKNWKQLYNEFFADFSGLVRKESELIRTELGEKTSLIKQGAVSITTGTIVAFVGVQAIAATIIIALGYVVSWWLAALITGVGLLLIGMALMAAAKKKLSGDSLTPHRSMESFDHMGSMFKEKKDEITRH